MRPLSCLLLAVVVAVACGGSTEPAKVDLSLSPTSTSVAGTFNLISANGTAPPFPAFSTTTQDWTLAADTVTIAANNTWTEATKYLVTSLFDGSTTTQYTVVAGSYAIANGQINFTMLQGGSSTFIGSVTDNMLTLIFNAKRFIYTK
jgi:hypothetical protein